MMPFGQHLTHSRLQGIKVKATENFLKSLPDKMEPPGHPGPRPPTEVVTPFGSGRYSEPLQAAS